MSLMTWGEHFVTGVDAIDVQHKGLVDLINAAAPLLAEAGEAQARAVQPLLDRVAEYAASHFKFEEALMAERGIDPGYCLVHRGTHAAFSRDVALMCREALENHNVSGNDLLRFLTGWLSFHILSEDQQWVRQLRAIEAGASAVQAYQAVERNDDDSRGLAVLTNAMVDLFSLLTARNRELSSLNRALRVAQTDLSAANQQLETRVAERTRQLESERGALLAANTRIEQAQEQLLQSEKMSAVGQLAAGVAHEINNPIGFVISNLGSLGTYVDQLLALIVAQDEVVAELPAEHPGHQALRAARAAAEIDFLRQDIPDLLRESNEGLARVKRIVSDLKDFSHIDEGEWRYADLHQGLESTLNVVSNEIKYKAEVFREWGELPLVHCIPAQINQVFMNLLVNAAQAIETRGSITLRTGVDGENVWVEIVDTGKGMTPEVRRRIFEPFYTTKPVGKGTGLGLSISYGIVERHGGQLAAGNTEAGGAEFTLRLPAAC